MDTIVLDHLTFAVMAIDKDFNITVANKMCKTILDIEPAEAIGRNIDEFFDNPPEFTRTVQHSLEQERDFRYDVFPYTWGKYRKTLSQRSTLLRADDGSIIGAMIEFEDITERHEREQQFRSFMEANSINIIPIGKGIGMLSMQTLPYEMDQSKFTSLGAEAMRKASKMDMLHLILDASSLSIIRMESNITVFNSLIKGFKLLGISIVIAGIRPEIAVHAVNAGIDIKGTRTFTNMSQAIDFLRSQAL
ncbi:PAS domain-containing protein [Bacillus sp. FJAT-27245]|uniref:PAS domain-containing protein n=1 Tax=Bacillus sp. FJAT-27245 TaxID=1684144 RepID=UPI0006A7A56F|nr:PAS domain-containing protein [Bacillus sp. FJAT-27245]